MFVRRLRLMAGGVATGVLAGLILAMSVAHAQEKGKLDLDKIPAKVMDALKARFPKPEIHKWTKETMDGKDFYDIEFKVKGQKHEADIREDGTFINYEKEIKAKDLPKAVAKAVESKFPKATLKEIMEITEVKGKQEKLEGYEVVLQTADNRMVELTLAPDGKIVAEEVLKEKQKK
ncbi:MAG: PepSY-like domain-containing protein [Gemmataceae bacterium]|nr:PepSY-like domain-containing protein [Gemmataceae bacterium]MCI0740564.1 PepSY-like domain-containing protein [Gemmataceae bacterium]